MQQLERMMQQPAIRLQQRRQQPQSRASGVEEAGAHTEKQAHARLHLWLLLLGHQHQQLQLQQCLRQVLEQQRRLMWMLTAAPADAALLRLWIATATSPSMWLCSTQVRTGMYTSVALAGLVSGDAAFVDSYS
jgi:hypothetical protein